MAFLYGDSTPSALESNFLELLRDALDFSVTVLQVDTNIERIHEHRRASSRAAEEEIERLQTFGRFVMAAIREAANGEEGSEIAHCAARHAALSSEAVNASIEAVNQRLATEIAQAEADEGAQREASFKALETLLLPHPIPEARVETRLERQAGGSYALSLVGDATIGLRWRIEVVIPEAHVLGGALSIERLAPQMEFLAPEPAGWLKKELKPRPQRLDRFALVEATDDGRQFVLRLRAVAGVDHGFSFTVDDSSSTVRATRTGGKDGEVAFDLAAEDTPKIVALAAKLRGALADLKEGRLVEATLDASDFRLRPAFKEVVERLVMKMSPTVQEIARHSLTQTELVIRRLLSNDRREEIFLAKATLREKYASLPREQQTLFESFGLETQPPPPPSYAPAPEAASAESVAPAPLRSEIPPSQPPPPPSWKPSVRPSWRRPPRSSAYGGAESGAPNPSLATGDERGERARTEGRKDEE